MGSFSNRRRRAARLPPHSKGVEALLQPRPTASNQAMIWSGFSGYGLDSAPLARIRRIDSAPFNRLPPGGIQRQDTVRHQPTVECHTLVVGPHMASGSHYDRFFLHVRHQSTKPTHDMAMSKPNASLEPQSQDRQPYGFQAKRDSPCPRRRLNPSQTPNSKPPKPRATSGPSCCNPSRK